MENKLEEFTKNKKQKRIVIVSVVGLILLIGAIVFYRTFALYEERLELNLLQGKVPEYTSGDVKIAAIIDGNLSSTIPGKEDGYAFESATCDNGATARWDDTNWEVIIGGLSKTKTNCTLNFVTKKH